MLPFQEWVARLREGGGVPQVTAPAAAPSGPQPANPLYQAYQSGAHPAAVAHALVGMARLAGLDRAAPSTPTPMPPPSTPFFPDQTTIGGMVPPGAMRPPDANDLMNVVLKAKADHDEAMRRAKLDAAKAAPGIDTAGGGGGVTANDVNGQRGNVVLPPQYAYSPEVQAQIAAGRPVQAAPSNTSDPTPTPTGSLVGRVLAANPVQGPAVPSNANAEPLKDATGDQGSRALSYIQSLPPTDPAVIAYNKYVAAGMTPEDAAISAGADQAKTQGVGIETTVKDAARAVGNAVIHPIDTAHKGAEMVMHAYNYPQHQVALLNAGDVYRKAKGQEPWDTNAGFNIGGGGPMGAIGGISFSGMEHQLAGSLNVDMDTWAREHPQEVINLYENGYAKSDGHGGIVKVAPGAEAVLKGFEDSRNFVENLVYQTRTDPFAAIQMVAGPAGEVSKGTGIARNLDEAARVAAQGTDAIDVARRFLVPGKHIAAVAPDAGRAAELAKAAQEIVSNPGAVDKAIQVAGNTVHAVDAVAKLPEKAAVGVVKGVGRAIDSTAAGERALDFFTEPSKRALQNAYNATVGQALQQVGGSDLFQNMLNAMVGPADLYAPARTAGADIVGDAARAAGDVGTAAAKVEGDIVSATDAYAVVKDKDGLFWVTDKDGAPVSTTGHASLSDAEQEIAGLTAAPAGPSAEAAAAADAAPPPVAPTEPVVPQEAAPVAPPVAPPTAPVEPVTPPEPPVAAAPVEAPIAPPDAPQATVADPYADIPSQQTAVQSNAPDWMKPKEGGARSVDRVPTLPADKQQEFFARYDDMANQADQRIRTLDEQIKHIEGDAALRNRAEKAIVEARLSVGADKLFADLSGQPAPEYVSRFAAKTHGKPITSDLYAAMRDTSYDGGVRDGMQGYVGRALGSDAADAEAVIGQMRTSNQPVLRQLSRELPGIRQELYGGERAGATAAERTVAPEVAAAPVASPEAAATSAQSTTPSVPGQPAAAPQAGQSVYERAYELAGQGKGDIERFDAESKAIEDAAQAAATDLRQSAEGQPSTFVLQNRAAAVAREVEGQNRVGSLFKETMGEDAPGYQPMYTPPPRDLLVGTPDPATGRRVIDDGWLASVQNDPARAAELDGVIEAGLLPHTYENDQTAREVRAFLQKQSGASGVSADGEALANTLRDERARLYPENTHGFSGDRVNANLDRNHSGDYWADRYLAQGKTIAEVGPVRRQGARDVFDLRFDDGSTVTIDKAASKSAQGEGFKGSAANKARTKYDGMLTQKAEAAPVAEAAAATVPDAAAQAAPRTLDQVNADIEDLRAQRRKVRNPGKREDLLNRISDLEDERDVLQGLGTAQEQIDRAGNLNAPEALSSTPGQRAAVPGEFDRAGKPMPARDAKQPRLGQTIDPEQQAATRESIIESPGAPGLHDPIPGPGGANAGRVRNPNAEWTADEVALANPGMTRSQAASESIRLNQEIAARLASGEPTAARNVTTKGMFDTAPTRVNGPAIEDLPPVEPPADIPAGTPITQTAAPIEGGPTANPRVKARIQQREPSHWPDQPVAPATGKPGPYVGLWEDAKQSATIDDGKKVFADYANGQVGPREQAVDTKYIKGRKVETYQNNVAGRTWKKADLEAQRFTENWQRFRPGTENPWALRRPSTPIADLIAGPIPTIGGGVGAEKTIAAAKSLREGGDWLAVLRDQADISDEHFNLLNETRSVGGKWVKGEDGKLALQGAETKRVGDVFAGHVLDGATLNEAIAKTLKDIAPNDAPTQRNRFVRAFTALYKGINNFKREHQMFGPRGAIGTINDMLGDTFTQITSGKWESVPTSLNLKKQYGYYKDLRSGASAMVDNGDLGKTLTKVGLAAKDLTGTVGREEVPYGQKLTANRLVERIMRGAGMGNESAEKWAGRLTEPIASQRVRTYREAGDLNRRLSLYEVEFRKQLVQGVDDFRTVIKDRATGGANADDLIAGLGDEFSPDDVRRLAKGAGFSAGDAERMARDWRNSLGSFDKAAFAEQNRIAFDFNPTRADELLKNFFLFHTWQFRAAPLYARNALRNPALMALYGKISHDLAADAAKRGDQHSGYLQLFETATGQLGYMNPSYLLSSALINLEPDRWTDPNATMLDKLIRSVPASVSPALQGIISAIGLSANSSPDLFGLSIDNRALLGLENYARSHGWMGADRENSLAPDAYGTSIQFPGKLFRAAQEFVTGSDQLPGQAAPSWLDPHRNDNQAIQARIRDLVYADNDIPTATSLEQLQKDHPEVAAELQDALLAWQTGDQNDYANRAFRDYTTGGLIGVGGSYTVPGGIQIAQTNQDALTRMRNDNANNSAGAAARGALDISRLGSPQATNLAFGSGAVKAAEGDNGQYLLNGWDDIVYGDDPAKTLGGAVRLPDDLRKLTSADIAKLPEDQRRQLADQWVQSLGPNAAMQLADARSNRDAATAANPEVGAYKDWSAAAKDSATGKQFRSDLIRSNKNYATYVAGYDAYVKSLQKVGADYIPSRDQYETSQDAYLAASGNAAQTFTPQSRGVNATAPYPAASAATAGSGGSGSSGSSASDGKYILNDLQDYQTNLMVYNRVLAQITGNPNASLEGMNPQARSAYVYKMQQMGLSEPQLPRSVEMYLQWQQVKQKQGKPSTIADYLAEREKIKAAGYSPDIVLGAALGGYDPFANTSLSTGIPPSSEAMTGTYLGQ